MSYLDVVIHEEEPGRIRSSTNIGRWKGAWKKDMDRAFQTFFFCAKENRDSEGDQQGAMIRDCLAEVNFERQKSI